VVEGRKCFAGPRCLDLRAETVATLGLGDATSPVRSTRRWRLALGPSDGSFTLRGFIHLEWGSELKVERLTPGESLGLLIGHRRVIALGADHDHLLYLAGLPAVRLRRPRAWDALAESRDALLGAISHYSEPESRSSTTKHRLPARRLKASGALRQAEAERPTTKSLKRKDPSCHAGFSRA
jgi:hypothetical protein